MFLMQIQDTKFNLLKTLYLNNMVIYLEKINFLLSNLQYGTLKYTFIV